MYKIVWKERVMDIIRVCFASFASRDERFRFALELEKRPGFVRVLEMSN